MGCGAAGAGLGAACSPHSNGAQLTAEVVAAGHTGRDGGDRDTGALLSMHSCGRGADTVLYRSVCETATM